MGREQGSLWDGGGRSAEPDLAQKQPVRDVLSQHEGRYQVVDGPRLPAMWPQHERMEAPLSGGPEDSVGSQAWCAQAPEPHPVTLRAEDQGSGVGSWPQSPGGRETTRQIQDWGEEVGQVAPAGPRAGPEQGLLTES